MTRGSRSTYRIPIIHIARSRFAVGSSRWSLTLRQFFYRSLQERYGFVTPVFDADIRVIITIVPVSFVAVDGGLTQKEIRDLTGLINKQAENDSRGN
jgi:hypothetical protein